MVKENLSFPLVDSCPGSNACKSIVMSSPILPAFFFQILKKSTHHGKHIEIKREIPPNLHNARIIKVGALTEKIKSLLKAWEKRNAWCRQVTP